MITVDWTITFGNMVEVACIIGGGLGVLVAMKLDIAVLKRDNRGLSDELKEMQQEVKKIGDVIMRQAVQDQRILNIEDDIRGLRRGDGFLRSPLVSRGGVDGEYP